MTDRDGMTRVSADVLVLGGGPSGCSAAIAAAESGARVVLADKGYCGTSGAAAAAGVGVWYVPPDPDAREAAMGEREALGGYLADRRWMARVLDETHSQVDRLAAWGYPFPVDDAGRSVRISLQGPELMRLLRRRVRRAGVTILDHSPALELLRGAAGEAAGATGLRRQAGGRWEVAAPAVVIATGGCAFRSGGLGCDVLTGDGHLMAAELGAELSGMEFSNAYAIAPSFSPVTKTAIYHHATFTHEDGSPIPGAGSTRGRSVVARTLLEGPVYCVLDGWRSDAREWLRRAQPNFFLQFDRMGIDPFTQRFPVTLRLEGTMRGTGGLRIAGDDCATTVPGVFAVGDAATRELVCGGFTGGGSHNAAWALSSGRWAGIGAARHAHETGPAVRGEPAGGVGLHPPRTAQVLTAREALSAVQAEVQPLDRNLFRTEHGLRRSLARLDGLWDEAGGGLETGEAPLDRMRAREAAAMVAHARWMYTAGLTRTETRGMHRREDHPHTDPSQRRRLRAGGLDRPWVDVDPVAPVGPGELAAVA